MRGLFHNVDLIIGGGTSAAAGEVPEVDETGTDLGSTGTVQIVKPTDNSSSFLEFTDSNGDTQSV